MDRQRTQEYAIGRTCQRRAAALGATIKLVLPRPGSIAPSKRQGRLTVDKCMSAWRVQEMARGEKNENARNENVRAMRLSWGAFEG
jgi:hypothetical protein